MKSTFEDLITQSRKLPILSKDETRVLFERVREGDNEAKQTLLKHNYRLVLSRAKVYHMKNLSTDLEDLFQDGIFGLAKAIDYFDFERENAFSTYAVYWIDQTISRNNLNHGDMIRKPTYKHELDSKAKKFIADYSKQHGVPPSLEQISQELDVSLEKVQSLFDPSLLPVASLNQPIHNNDDEKFELGSLIPSTTGAYDKLEDNLDLRVLLWNVKKSLSDKDYFILYHRCLREDCKFFSQKMIGYMFGVSSQRIQKVEKEILGKLRSFLVDDNDKYSPSSLEFPDFLELEVKNLYPAPYDTYYLNYLSLQLNSLQYYIFFHLLFNKDFTEEEVLATLEMTESQLEEVMISIEEKLRVLQKQYHPQGGEKVYHNTLKKKGENFLYKKLFTPDSLTYEQFIEYEREKNIFVKKSIQESLIQKENRSSLNQKNMTFTIREINLKKLGYLNAKKTIEEKDFIQTYRKNRDRFTALQQLYIRHYLLHNLTYEDLQSLSKRNVPDTYWNDVKEKLEMIYFGIHRYFDLPVTKEMIDSVLKEKSHKFTPQQFSYLDQLYGISNAPKPFEEIVRSNGGNQDVVRDRLKVAKEKILRLYYHLEAKDLYEEREKYLPYLHQEQYTLSESVRKILCLFFEDGKTRPEIAKELGITRLQAENQVLNGVKKLDLYRYQIIKPSTITQERIQTYYGHIDSSSKSLDKKIVYLRHFEGLSTKEIAQKTDRSTRTITQYLSSFEYDFNSAFYQDVTLTEEDYKNEILCHSTDSILTKEERAFLEDSSKQVLTETISDSSISKMLAEIQLKIKMKKEKAIAPKYGILSVQETKNALKDVHLPISSCDRNFLIDLKGIGTKTLSEKQLAEKYNVSVKQILRKYQYTILNILKYQNEELDPIFHFEEDLEGILCYFPKYEQHLISLLYREKANIPVLSQTFGISKDQVINDIETVHVKIKSILEGNSQFQSYNFDQARQILEHPQLPIQENRNIKIEIYNLYFGEDGTPPLKASEIAKKFNITRRNDIVESVYQVMLAVKRFEYGIRSDKKELSKEEITTYIAEHWQEFTPGEKKSYARVLVTSKNEGPKHHFPNSLFYRVLSERQEMPFQFENTTKQEAITLQKTVSLSATAKKTLRAYYEISDWDLMNGKLKHKTIRSFEQIFDEKYRKKQARSSSNSNQYQKGLYKKRDS